MCRLKINIICHQYHCILCPLHLPDVLSHSHQFRCLHCVYSSESQEIYCDELLCCAAAPILYSLSSESLAMSSEERSSWGTGTLLCLSLDIDHRAAVCGNSFLPDFFLLIKFGSLESVSSTSDSHSLTRLAFFRSDFPNVFAHFRSSSSDESCCLLNKVFGSI